jgi:hypothetical protein
MMRTRPGRFWMFFSLVLINILIVNMLFSQVAWNADSLYKTGQPLTGRLWGYAFGDLYNKVHGDTLNRGGTNQYTGIPQGRTEFQTRRIYLGYDFNISRKFSTEILLAAEDNITTGGGTTSGDLLADNKLAFYVKLINLRWKNIWKGTDLVIGQVGTPGFTTFTEKFWGYRSIERTLIDVRRTPSYDLGVALQGKFGKSGNLGYNVMVGNGSGARPESDNFKWFYSEVWGLFLDKRLAVSLYADYERLNAQPEWHHSRSMFKAYAAYTTDFGTLGIEGYVNNLMKDLFATRTGGIVDTMSSVASGISIHAQGDIVRKKLKYFIRYDHFDPTNRINNAVYSKYVGHTANFNDPVTRESLFIAGLDFMPIPSVHFMPNIWCNSYKNQGAAFKYDSYDLVLRMTFFFVFGKN